MSDEGIEPEAMGSDSDPAMLKERSASSQAPVAPTIPINIPRPLWAMAQNARASSADDAVAEETPVIYDMTMGDSSVSPERVMSRRHAEDDWFHEGEGTSEQFEEPAESSSVQPSAEPLPSSSPERSPQPRLPFWRGGQQATALFRARAAELATPNATPRTPMMTLGSPLGSPLQFRQMASELGTQMSRVARSRCQSVPAVRCEQRTVWSVDDESGWNELMQCNSLEEFVQSHSMLRQECKRLQESQVMCFKAIQETARMMMAERSARQEEAEDRKRLQEEMRLMRSTMEMMLQMQGASLPATGDTPAVRSRLEELEREQRELRQLLADTKCSRPIPAGAATLAAATAANKEASAASKGKSRRGRSPRRRPHAEEGWEATMKQMASSLPFMQDEPKKKKKSSSDAKSEKDKPMTSFF